MDQRRPLLYVDDEVANLVVFEAAFEDEFDVHVAESAREALAMLDHIVAPVVVSDQRMPEMTGTEMFRILRQRDPHSQRVILSGFTDTDSLIDAINSGQIFQFVRKPWDRDELLTVLRRAYEAHDLALQNSILQEKLVLSDRLSLLGKTAATIAHEMGNQLGVLPLVELIEDEYQQEPPLVEMAAVARMTHDRLTSLVGEIQSFVRSDAQMEHPSRFSLAHAVHELLMLIKYTQLAPAELIHTEIQRDSTFIGHPFKLQQVLINLIRNAADALRGMQQGRIDIVVSRDHSEAVIDVIDNGPGIPVELRDRIWEPFFTTKGKSGSGLGLDVVRTIIESHRGSVSVLESSEAGTTFRIRLPASVQTDTNETSSTLGH